MFQDLEAARNHREHGIGEETESRDAQENIIQVGLFLTAELQVLNSARKSRKLIIKHTKIPKFGCYLMKPMIMANMANTISTQ